MAQMTNGTTTADQVKGMVETGRERAAELKDRITETAGDAKEKLVDAGGVVRQKLSDAKDVAFAAGDSALTTTRQMIKQHPLAAVGVAFGLGYVAMWLMRRS